MAVGRVWLRTQDQAEGNDSTPHTPTLAKASKGRLIPATPGALERPGQGDTISLPTSGSGHVGGHGGKQNKGTRYPRLGDPLPVPKGRDTHVLTRQFDHDATWGQTGRRDTARVSSWERPWTPPQSPRGPAPHRALRELHGVDRADSPIGDGRVIRAWGREGP